MTTNPPPAVVATNPPQTVATNPLLAVVATNPPPAMVATGKTTAQAPARQHPGLVATATQATPNPLA